MLVKKKIIILCQKVVDQRKYDAKNTKTENREVSLVDLEKI